MTFQIFEDYNTVGCLRKSQLGFGLGLLIFRKTEAQWIFRNVVMCKAELPPMTREKTDFVSTQSKNRCLLAYTPGDHPDTRRTSNKPITVF